MQSIDSIKNPSEQVKFSAYRGTTNAGWLDVLNALTDGYPYLDLHLGRANVPGYGHGMYIKRGRNHVARILWSPGKGEVFFEVNEGHCKEGIPRLRERIRHEVSSACLFVETSQALAFEDILTRCAVVQKAYPRIRAVRHGDWSDQRKGSRTFCLGSSSSACQIVLRQAAPGSGWYQRRDDGLVRLEWRIRPDDQQQRSAAAASTADQFLCYMSEMASHLADLVLSEELIHNTSIDVVPALTLAERRPDDLVGAYSNRLDVIEKPGGNQDILVNVMDSRLLARSTMHWPS